MGEGIASIFIGRSDAERDALMRLINREDEIFQIQPGEEKFLGRHVHADIPRFQLLNARFKLLTATTDRKSDRNFYATVGLGAAIFVKSGVSWAEIFHWLMGAF